MLSPGEILDRNYYVDEVLDVGLAGPTYLARELGPDGRPVDPPLRIEVLFPTHAAGPHLQRLVAQSQVLRDVPHRHLAQLRGFVHRAGHPPYLITRHEAGGTLQDLVSSGGPLSEAVALGIATQLAHALAALHRRGHTHLDLAPRQVWLEPVVDGVPHCRLASPGAVGTVADGYVDPAFSAPEQLEPHAVTPAADVFALGALLWWMVEGDPLPRITAPDNPTRCLDDWITALARRPRGLRGDEVERWLEQTLRATPEQRPTAAKLAGLPAEPASVTTGVRVGAGGIAQQGVPDPHTEVDPDLHETEVNAPWAEALGSGAVPALVTSGEQPRSPHASGSGTLARTSPSLASRSGLRPSPSPARRVFTAAAAVVGAFLVAAAGVVVGYVAMSTWGL